MESLFLTSGFDAKVDDEVVPSLGQFYSSTGRAVVVLFTNAGAWRPTLNGPIVLSEAWRSSNQRNFRRAPALAMASAVWAASRQIQARRRSCHVPTRVSAALVLREHVCPSSSRMRGRGTAPTRRPGPGRARSTSGPRARLGEGICVNEPPTVPPARTMPERYRATSDRRATAAAWGLVRGALNQRASVLRSSEESCAGRGCRDDSGTARLQPRQTSRVGLARDSQPSRPALRPRLQHSGGDGSAAPRLAAVAPLPGDLDEHRDVRPCNGERLHLGGTPDLIEPELVHSDGLRRVDGLRGCRSGRGGSESAA